MNKKPAVLIGGGGHARVLLDALRLLKIEVAGIADPELRKGSKIADVEVVGTDEDLLKRFKPQSVCLVNGVGTTRVSAVRKNIYEKFKALGYEFLTVVHPSSIIAADVLLSEGVQVMAGTVIQTGSKIGINTIINTCASVDHDCHIGAHVHIAPGAVLCGGIEIGERSHIGAGATIVQNCQIESGTLVRAGKTFTGMVIPGTSADGDHV